MLTPGSSSGTKQAVQSSSAAMVAHDYDCRATKQTTRNNKESNNSKKNGRMGGGTWSVAGSYG